MARIDIKSAGATLNDGVLQLENGVAMDATLRNVADQNNTTSPLKLSTTAVQVVSPLRITTDDPSDFYLDCEDGATNNRFSIKRNTASQQVNVDFASNPGTATETVGAIRTYADGTNLSEAMAFRRNGTVGIGTTSPTAKLQIKGSGSTSATTSLLVQNSAGTELFKVTDDGVASIRQAFSFILANTYIDGSGWYPTVNNYFVSLYGDGGASSGVRVTGSSFSGGASQVQIKGSTSISNGFNQPNASAQLDVSSTTKGFLPPRMTTAQKNAIATPAAGLMVYDTTLNKLCVYTTAWETITSV
jgi:hypothetical protein